MTAEPRADATRVSLSVVIPAFNEAARLPGTLVQVTSYLTSTPWDWEVRVVDDGSTDATADAVKAVTRSDPRVVLQREPHRGKGGAVRAGMLAARAQYRFICDADLSMPIREIARFLPPVLPGTDVAIGSRELPGARRVGEPLRRHLVGRAFNRAVKLLVFDGIEDTQCGFKMFTREAAEAVFPQATLDGWAFDIEVLAIARARGLRIVEVPIEWHYRAESHIRVGRDGVAMLRDLLAVRRRAKRGMYSVRDRA